MLPVMMHAAIVEISHDLLAEWLHLPQGVRIDAVVSGKNPGSFVVRMRSDNDFLPLVPYDGRAPTGTLVVTVHEPTVEFKAYT